MKRTPPLSTEAIRSALGKEHRELPIFIYEVTDSTNLRALEYAKERGSYCGAAVFVALTQTAGRGRLGRSFASPEGGIYMSILTPCGSTADAVAITAYAATAICQALENECKIEPKIKWVNDLYLGGKKLSGILTQGVVDTESGKITHAVMGVGINLSGRLPDEISGIATTVEAECGTIPDRTALIAKIITLYLDSLNEVGTKKTADEYRRRSFLIGKSVRVIRVDREYTAKVDGISDSCELLLTLEDGSHEALATGEVSVREA